MNKMIDILIIGSGPAGLTAAIYAQRAGKHAVVYEANSYGGKIINAPEIDSKHLPSDETMIDVCKRTKEFFEDEQIFS